MSTKTTSRKVSRSADASLVDVAREAKASLGTVSRVMNGNDTVSDDLRRRVIKAGRKLGFAPKRRRRTVAVITGRQSPGMPVGYVSVMTSLLMRGALQRDAGIELFDIEQLDKVASCHIDAAVGVVFDDRLQALNDYPSLPVVAINHPMADQGISSVYTDHYDQGYSATRHLLERGHQQIAFLAIEPDEWGSRERRRGCEEALAEAGLELDPAHARYTVDVPAYDLLQRWSRNGVSAILNFSEDTAGEVLHILTNILHQRIGHDISTITLEDLPIYQYFSPPQTVIRQPLEALADLALDHALNQTRDDDVLDRCLKGELVIRDSVADLRQQTNPLAGQGERQPAIPR